MTDLDDRPASTRRVGRRRSLPGSRAVVGALLVASALVVTFAAYTEATTVATRRYVVAAHDLRMGEVLEAQDLTTVELAPPPRALRTRVFEEVRPLIGAVVVGPLAKGELVQASDVVAGDAQRGTYEVSIPIERARSVGGSLVPGDIVDLAATFGTGADAYTAYVVRGAKVIALDRERDSLGGGSGDVITLALDSSDEALAVSHALSAGEISVVRATGAPGPTDASAPYRAPASQPKPEQVP